MPRRRRRVHPIPVELSETICLSFETNNRSEHDSPELDLHGYYLQDAVEEVANFLDAYDESDVPELIIITGKGLHSAEGPVLKPEIENYLDRRGYVYKEDPYNWGRLLVDNGYKFFGRGRLKTPDHFESLQWLEAICGNRSPSEVRSTSASSSVSSRKKPLSTSIQQIQSRSKSTKKSVVSRKQTTEEACAEISDMSAQLDNHPVSRAAQREFTISKKEIKKAGKRQKRPTPATSELVTKQNRGSQPVKASKSPKFSTQDKRFFSPCFTFGKNAFSICIFLLLLSVNFCGFIYRLVYRLVATRASVNEEFERLRNIYNCRRSCMMRLSKMKRKNDSKNWLTSIFFSTTVSGKRKLLKALNRATKIAFAFFCLGVALKLLCDVFLVDF